MSDKTAMGRPGRVRNLDPAGLWREALRTVGAWVEAWSRMSERGRQRRALADLDDHLLRDIGMTRDHARREAEKPFWKR